MSVTTNQFAGIQSGFGIFQRNILIFSAILFVLVGSDIFAITIPNSSVASKFRFVVLVPMLGITILYYRQLLRGFFASPGILLLLLLAAASVAWSVNPAISIERGVSLWVTTCFAIVIGSVTSSRGLVMFLAGFGATVVILSLVAIAIFPEARGNPPWDNVWTGIFNHKNGLGAAALMSLIFLVGATPFTRDRLRTTLWVLAALALGLLLVSASRSAQLFGVISMTALVIGFLAQRYAMIWTVWFLVFVVFGIVATTVLLASSFADPLFGFFGRKPTLSNRIPLWELVWPYTQDRFWLGYGYYAFWSEEVPYKELIGSSKKLGFDPHYSHNGVLEVWLHVGFVGVLVLAMVFVRFFRNCFLMLRVMVDRHSAIPLFVGVMTFFLANFTEGSFLSRNQFGWMIFVAIIVNVSLHAKDLRRQAKLRRLYRWRG